jgi:hypothetical protein
MRVVTFEVVENLILEHKYVFIFIFFLNLYGHILLQYLIVSLVYKTCTNITPMTNKTY